MNKWMSSSQMEESIVQAFGVPEIRSEFIEQVYDELMRSVDSKTGKVRGLPRLRPAWTITFAILILVVITILSIGPLRVYATFRQLLGYIPGVGIVEQSDGLRVLSEPVQMTIDGITVSVNHAVLTATETKLNFGISGVPMSAYPEEESVSGCLTREYLRFSDGTHVEITDPIPPDVHEATFVLPCIFNTVPGSVPTDWELLLTFISAPDDLILLPVVPVATSTAVIEHIDTTESPTEVIPDEPEPAATVTIDQIIETEDGYILLGAVRPSIVPVGWLQITGAASIHDAGGNKVSYNYPEDIQAINDPTLLQGGYPWVMQIKSAGVKFPLTISFSGVITSQVDPQSTARIMIDVGANPQLGQVWEVDQDVQLAGYTIRLVSLTAQADGYSLRIDPGSDLSGVSVQFEDYQAIGGGGGSGCTQQGEFTTSMIFDTLPTGELNLLFSNPITTSPTETWQVEWQPDSLPTYPTDTIKSDICWNANTFSSIPPLADGLDGKVVFTQMNPQLQIVLANMDGSDQQVIAEGGSRAAITLDGSDLAYATDDGIVIQNLQSGETSFLSDILGRDLHWSPDKNQIAMVSSGDSYGIFVIGRESNHLKQLSNLGYESIAGWSKDASNLYYAIPGSNGDGFLLRSVDVQTGNTQDLFVLENSSLKAPLPAVSPDGEWIAYRARDNNSLYLMRMDGSEARMLLDTPGIAINGIAWEKAGHLLGVSVITEEHSDGTMILIAPDSCETYQLPGLSGELDGVFIP